MTQQYVPELGKLITGDAYRDAVHVAVMPCTAGQALGPGALVLVEPDGRARARSPAWLKAQSDAVAKLPVGVVDPFLLEEVPEGARFWLFCFPNTVQSLRHSWIHQAFRARVPGEGAGNG